MDLKPLYPTPINLECRAITAADLPADRDDSNRCIRKVYSF